MSKLVVLLVIAAILAAVPAFGLTKVTGGPPPGIVLTGPGTATSWGTGGILSTILTPDWYNVYRTDVNGNSIKLSQGANATWSPDGSKYACWTIASPGTNTFALTIHDIASGSTQNTGVISGDFQRSINWAKDGNIYFTWTGTGSDWNSTLGSYNTTTGTATKLTTGKINGYMDPYWVGDSTVGCWYADITGIRFASIWNGQVWHDDLWIGKWGQDTLRYPTVDKNGHVFFSAGNYIYKWNGSLLDGIDKGYRPVLGPYGGYASSGGIGWTTTPFQPVPEPSSLLALGSGLIGLGGLVLRRRG